jgi:hypothetical protein
MKIGILIPTTSYKREWNDIFESYLYNITLKTFLISYDKEHNYKFYIGIDENDNIFDNKEEQQKILNFINVMKNVSLEFILMENIEKGHLTIMWNKLFKKAYNEGCDYFFQCGDDIEFKTKGWVNSCIETLQENNNIGLTGPINNNPNILTQSFVSRKHMDFFGYYFPPEIINWFCDDWINEIYKKINCFFPLRNHLCINIGGLPRYEINNDSNFRRDFNNKMIETRKFCLKIVKRDYEKIKLINLIKNNLVKIS